MRDGWHITTVTATVVCHCGLMMEGIHIYPIVVSICVVVMSDVTSLVHAYRANDLVVHADDGRDEPKEYRWWVLRSVLRRATQLEGSSILSF